MPAQSALNMILKMKSPEDLEEVTKELDANWDDLIASADSIGTLHSMRWVVLDETTLGLFTVYDGDFETYAQDFLRYVGPLFDLLLSHTQDPPPMPVQKNPQEFVAWSRARDDRRRRPGRAGARRRSGHRPASSTSCRRCDISC